MDRLGAMSAEPPPRPREDGRPRADGSPHEKELEDGLLEQLRERFPRVAVVHDWLTIPGGSEQVVLELLEMFPASGAVHRGVRPRAVAGADHRSPRSQLLPEPRPRRQEALPQAAAADEQGIPLVRPVFLRPGPLEQPCLREERPHATRRAARLLLPHADALRMGEGLPGRRGHRSSTTPAARPACTAAPTGSRGLPWSGRVRGQLAPCGGAHQALLWPFGRGRAPTRRRRAFPGAASCPPLRPGLLPGVREGRPLQAGRHRRRGLHQPGARTEGRGRRPCPGGGARRRRRRGGAARQGAHRAPRPTAWRSARAAVPRRGGLRDRPRRGAGGRGAGHRLRGGRGLRVDFGRRDGSALLGAERGWAEERDRTVRALGAR